MTGKSKLAAQIQFPEGYLLKQNEIKFKELFGFDTK